MKNITKERSRGQLMGDGLQGAASARVVREVLFEDCWHCILDMKNGKGPVL